MGTSPALGGHGEDREFRLQFLALAFGALGFLLAKYESFKFVLALFTGVFEDGHEEVPAIPNSYLKSKRG